MSQAKRIVSVIKPTNAKTWVEKAATLKQRDLEREVKATFPSPPPTERIKPVGGEMSELKLVIPEAMRKKLERLQEVRGCSILEAFDFAMDETLKRHDPIQKATRSSRNIKLKVAARDNAQRHPAALQHASSLPPPQGAFVYNRIHAQNLTRHNPYAIVVRQRAPQNRDPMRREKLPALDFCSRRRMGRHQPR